MRDGPSIKAECLVYKNGRLVHRFESRSLLGNFAKYLFGILTNANVSDVFDISGAGYTARTSGSVNVASLTFVIGIGSAAPSPDDYTLTSLTELPTLTWTIEYGNFAQLYVIGSRTATAAETWREVGFIQSLYDTAGTARKTLLARDVLPSPLSMNPYDVAVLIYVITVTV